MATDALVDVGGLTSPVPILDGGTGQTTKTAAMDALSPSTTKGDVLVDDGTNLIRLAVGADDAVIAAASGEASGLIFSAISSLVNLGKIIQIGGYSVDVTDRSTTNTIPVDDTIPQISEMSSTAASVGYTPISADTVTYVFGWGQLGSNQNNSNRALGIRKTLSDNILSIGSNSSGTATLMASVSVSFRLDHSDTSPQTWLLYFGGNVGTTFLNRRSAGAQWGNTHQTALLVLEVLE